MEEFILKITDFLQHFFGEDKNISYVGQAIGYENPFVFKVEVDINKTKAHIIKGDLVRISLKGEYDVFGVVVDQKILLNKKWLTVYLLRDQDNFIHATSLQIPSHKTLFQTNYSVNKVSLENLGESLKETIAGNPLYENRSKFIGYIEQGSDINCIKFYILPGIMEEPVVEGSVVSSSINGKNVLFQVINGNTQEESLEHHNNHSFISVTARKIGEYDELKKEIISARWLPEMYMPVFSLKNESYLLEEGNKTSVGSLPNTPYSIEIKNFNELVTHNTAILGILGIGKSCLTFELIQKVILNTTAKIICIDITNEYKKELVNYFDKSLIKEELSSDSLKELKDNNKTGVEGDPSTWGNEVLYKTKLDAELATFSSDTTSRVLILNPDLHSVSKAGSSFKIQHKTDLTVSEKTRTISERVFMNAKKQWDILTEEVRDKSEAQFLIVFEEAHSLIPEWNSTANSGDQSASNGTAKVILQGRKYGLGSFVVTQRTANISKSILNQCNTIFALRVFDDTGKQFLENYIGSDYASTLPTLEERHAITIGKALKLKQPIIISLNDKKIIIKSKETSN